MQQQALNAMSEQMDQFLHMLKFVLDTQNSVHQDSPHEHRLIGHDDRMNVSRGIHSRFLHFDGNNPIGWGFKANQFFKSIKHLIIKSWLWSHFIWKEMPWYGTKMP